MRAVRHIVLWFTSMLLFALAFLGLELAEGNKIGTTEYYGLRNLGMTFVAMAALVSAVLYPLILWPLSWAMRKMAAPAASRAAVVLLCVLGGYAVFHGLYDERFVREYGLTSVTAMIVFGAAGVLYVLVDGFMDRRG